MNNNLYHIYTDKLETMHYLADWFYNFSCGYVNNFNQTAISENFGIMRHLVKVKLVIWVFQYLNWE